MMQPRYAKRNPLIVINPEAEVAKAKDIIPWTPVPTLPDAAAQCAHWLWQGSHIPTLRHMSLSKRSDDDGQRHYSMLPG